MMVGQRSLLSCGQNIVGRWLGHVVKHVYFLEEIMKVNAKLKLAITGLALSAIAGAAQAECCSGQRRQNQHRNQAMREQVLAGAGMAIDYQGNDGGPWLTRLQAELKAGSGEIVCWCYMVTLLQWIRLILLILAYPHNSASSTFNSLESWAPATCSISHGCRPATSWRQIKRHCNICQKGQILIH